MKFAGLALVLVFTFGGLLIAMHFNFEHFVKIVMTLPKVGRVYDYLWMRGRCVSCGEPPARY